MGLKFEMVPSLRKELVSASCDRCKKALGVRPGEWNPYGEAYSLYHEAVIVEPHYVSSQVWGYGSSKDGQMDNFVLCEPCYDSVLGSF